MRVVLRTHTSTPGGRAKTAPGRAMRTRYKYLGSCLQDRERETAACEYGAGAIRVPLVDLVASWREMGKGQAREERAKWGH